MSALSLSGNEITDATRATNTQGDGLSNDSSFGIWPAATNRAVNGNATTNTTGVTDSSATTTRVTTGVHKFGATHFNVVTGNAASNEGSYEAINGGVANTQYTASVWAWAASGSPTVMVTIYDDVAGRQSSAAVTLTTTPQKIRKTATTGVGAATFRVYVETDAQQNVTFQWGGLQVETGSVATPYIETDGGTVTRSAGRISAKAAGILNTTQGWVAMRIRSGTATGDATGYRWFSFGDSANERLEGVMGSTTHSLIKQTGGAGTSASQAVTRAVGDKITGTFAWTSAIAKLSLNGAAFTSQANTSVPAVTTNTFFDIGRQNYGGNFWLTGDCLWFACGSGTLTDADAAALHAFGDTDPTPQQLFANLSAAARPTAVWPADTAVYSAMLAVPPARITGPWRVWPSRRRR